MARDRGQEPLTVIGWREYVALPLWGLEGIKAKADTGARSNALDVTKLEELPGERVRFEAVVDRRGAERTVAIEAPIARRGRVRSSFGRDHDRIFVLAEVALAGHVIEAELGLVSRQHMLCRMLLGRKCLEHVFLVDPGRAYLHGRRKRKKRSGGGRKSP